MKGKTNTHPKTVPAAPLANQIEQTSYQVVPGSSKSVVLRFVGYDDDGVQCYSFSEHLDGIDVNR